MRDPERIDEFCDKLKEYWHQVPDWRFGQLVVNVLGQDPFYVEDDATLAAFDRMFNYYHGQHL